MVAGGEAGNCCTGTWRTREDCRNCWKVNMVAGGQAGNGCRGTWRRDHCRNTWKVNMVAGGQAGNGYACTWKRDHCRNTLEGGRKVTRGWLYSYPYRQEVLIGQEEVSGKN